MNEFGCDYQCKTVGEGIIKYDIPSDWCAEFDIYDDNYPIICIRVGRIRKTPALMNLKLRVVENPNDEYAGCIVIAAKKVIAFKIECMCDLVRGLETDC